MSDNEINKNLLPKDGTVLYHGKILEESTADNFFQSLLNSIAWKPDEVFIFGKKHITKRKTAWYGDVGLEYTYSRSAKKPCPGRRSYSN